MSNTVLNLEINRKTMTMDGKASGDAVYKITSLEGLSASDIELNLVANGQDHGSRMAGRRVTERTITIEGRYRGKREQDAIREEMIAFFNPLHTGTLTVQQGDITRKIDFVVSGFEIKQKGTQMAYQVILTCAKPFFRDASEYAENMAGRTAMIHAPLAFASVGLVSSIKKFKQEMAITNYGHKETGIRIEIVARGAVVNPRLDNLTTGEYIKVNVTMATGDVLLINTNKGETDITLNGVGVNNKKDRGSRYFKLFEGVNTLKYNADEGYIHMDVFPRYTAEYLGI